MTDTRGPNPPPEAVWWPLGPFSPILPVPVGEGKAEDRTELRQMDYVIGCPPGLHSQAEKVEQQPETWDEWVERYQAFRKDLETLINKHSMDNGTNTPDYMLADFLTGCLTAYDETVARRDAWRS